MSISSPTEPSLQNLIKRFDSFSTEVLSRLDRLEARIVKLEAVADPVAAKTSDVAEPVIADIAKLEAPEPASFDFFNREVEVQIESIDRAVYEPDFPFVLEKARRTLDFITNDRSEVPVTKQSVENLEKCAQGFFKGLNGQDPTDEEKALLFELRKSGLECCLRSEEYQLMQVTKLVGAWLPESEGFVALDGADLEAMKNTANQNLELLDAKAATGAIQEVLRRGDLEALEGVLQATDQYVQSYQPLVECVQEAKETLRKYGKAQELVGDAYDFLEASQFEKAAEYAMQAQNLGLISPSIEASIADILEKAVQANEAAAQAAAVIKGLNKELDGYEERLHDSNEVPSELRDFAKSEHQVIRERACKLLQRMEEAENSRREGYMLIQQANKAYGKGNFAEARAYLDRVTSKNPTVLDSKAKWTHALDTILSAEAEKTEEKGRELLVQFNDKINEKDKVGAAELLKQVKELNIASLLKQVESGERRLGVLLNNLSTQEEQAALSPASSTTKSPLQSRTSVEVNEEQKEVSSDVAAMAAQSLPPVLSPPPSSAVYLPTEEAASVEAQETSAPPAAREKAILNDEFQQKLIAIKPMIKVTKHREARKMIMELLQFELTEGQLEKLQPVIRNFNSKPWTEKIDL